MKIQISHKISQISTEFTGSADILSTKNVDTTGLAASFYASSSLAFRLSGFLFIFVADMILRAKSVPCPVREALQTAGSG